MASVALAKPEDLDEIVDLLNLTFSMAHRPHDFRLLQPKAYAKGRDCAAEHYIVREDGRIRSSVGVYPETLMIGDAALRVGMVGGVAVHPYDHGRGYMRLLMQAAAEDCARKYDLSALSGQRQRYGYFGYYPMGVRMAYFLDQANVRHGLNDVDDSAIRLASMTEDDPEQLRHAARLNSARPIHVEREAARFLDIARTEKEACLTILKNGEMAGYIIGGLKEVALDDENDLPGVLKAWFSLTGAPHAEMPVSMFETARREKLAALCEFSRVQGNELYAIHNPAAVMQALLRLKNSHTPLAEGRAVIGVEGLVDALALEVQAGEARAYMVQEAPAYTYTKEAFYRLYLSPEGAFSPLPALLKQWLPLEMDILGADFF